MNFIPHEIFSPLSLCSLREFKFCWTWRLLGFMPRSLRRIRICWGQVWELPNGFLHKWTVNKLSQASSQRVLFRLYLRSQPKKSFQWSLDNSVQIKLNFLSTTAILYFSLTRLPLLDSPLTLDTSKRAPIILVQRPSTSTNISSTWIQTVWILLQMMSLFHYVTLRV